MSPLNDTPGMVHVIDTLDADFVGGGGDELVVPFTMVDHDDAAEDAGIEDDFGAADRTITQHTDVERVSVPLVDDGGESSNAPGAEVPGKNP